jgi:hypothetical protein
MHESQHLQLRDKDVASQMIGQKSVSNPRIPCTGSLLAILPDLLYAVLASNRKSPCRSPCRMSAG